MPKSKKQIELEQRNAELTADLQRLRADFENYRKQVEREKSDARTAGAEAATRELLPVIDNIERAIAHTPDDIAAHAWVKGIAGLVKQLDKVMNGLGLERIDAQAGAAFDPELHQAVQFDEDSEGEREVITEELQPGYRLHGRVIRHSMVRVARS
ncbi:nucleotide exchange factor GrpE [Candidatus Saccharibacteria bacterium]|nr:MAG: nucleotide exchange factor GrpE [Candidatus Saccharibacteria bacterium]